MKIKGSKHKNTARIIHILAVHLITFLLVPVVLVLVLNINVHIQSRQSFWDIADAHNCFTKQRHCNLFKAYPQVFHTGSQLSLTENNHTSLFGQKKDHHWSRKLISTKIIGQRFEIVWSYFLVRMYNQYC